MDAAGRGMDSQRWHGSRWSYRRHGVPGRRADTVVLFCSNLSVFEMELSPLPSSLDLDTYTNELLPVIEDNEHDSDVIGSVYSYWTE